MGYSSEKVETRIMDFLLALGVQKLKLEAMLALYIGDAVLDEEIYKAHQYKQINDACRQ